MITNKGNKKNIKKTRKELQVKQQSQAVKPQHREEKRKPFFRKGKGKREEQMNSTNTEQTVSYDEAGWQDDSHKQLKGNEKQSEEGEPEKQKLMHLEQRERLSVMSKKIKSNFEKRKQMTWK